MYGNAFRLVSIVLKIFCVAMGLIVISSSVLERENARHTIERFGEQTFFHVFYYALAVLFAVFTLKWALAFWESIRDDL